MLGLWVGVAMAAGWPALPEGTTVLESDAHPEFHRWTLEVPGQGAPAQALQSDGRARLVLEVTPHRVGAQPVCSGEGLDLWVRLDLDQDGPESFDWEPLPQVVDDACETLDQAPRFPKIYPPEPQAEIERPDRPRTGPSTLRPFHGVVALWVIALIACFPRHRAALGAGLVGLLVRLGLSPDTVLLGGDAAFERHVVARGAFDVDRVYGPTWAAINSPFVSQWGDEALHWVNLAGSALGVPLAAGIAGWLWKDRSTTASWSAGLILAFMPLSVALAATETHFVWVATLQLAAVWGCTRKDALGDGLAALSVALLVGLRPGQMVFALGIASWAGWGKRWALLALALAAVGVRVATLPSTDGVGILGLQRWLDPAMWWHLRGDLVPLNPRITPALLVAAGGLGLAALRWNPEARGIAAIGFVGVLPYLTKTSPLADPLRFQLAGLGWLAVFAGVGVAVIWSHTRVRGVGLVLLVLSWFPALRPMPRWVWMDEHDFLVDLEPTEPVYFDATEDPNFHMWLWLERDGAVWEPGPAPPGALRFVGFSDALHGRQECAGETLTERWVYPHTDGWVDLGERAVHLALIRCDDAD